MSESFSLVSEPWIEVERLDGSVAAASTLEVLSRAHELRGIVADPLESAALHRHLLAVLHRAYEGPASRKEWLAIVRAKRFDDGRVGAYLERVGGRMDLFHPTHPFAQTRGLAEKFKVSAIELLGFERSMWGAGRELFQHRSENFTPDFSPARAARALLAHHAFAAGGLVRKPGEPTAATNAPLVRSAVVLLRGRTLFDTLVSNLLVYSPEDSMPISGTLEDAPSWEQPPPPRDLDEKKEPQHLPLGWLDLLTWTSRRLELVRDGDLITGFVRAVGKGLAEGTPRDPMVTYKRSDKFGEVCIGLDRDRVFWREAPALFASGLGTGDKGFHRPKALDQVSSREALEVLGHDVAYTLDVLGLNADSKRLSVIYLIRAEHLRALARLFEDGSAFTEVELAIKNAETAVFALRTALRDYARTALSPGDRDPDPKDVSALVSSFGAEREAWSALKLHFDELLSALGKSDDRDECRHRFAGACRSVAMDRYAAATAVGRDSGRWLQAEAIGRRTLAQRLVPLRESEKRAPASEERGKEQVMENPQ